MSINIEFLLQLIDLLPTFMIVGFVLLGLVFISIVLDFVRLHHIKKKRKERLLQKKAEENIQTAI